jgi:hypothetical protein
MKTLFTAACVALVAAAVATAAPPPKKTDTTSTTPCRANVAVILTGKLAADGTATALSVTVTGGNAAGKAYKALTQPLSVAVDTKTKVVRNGASKAENLKSGDKVNIQAKACKKATPGSVTATKVVARPPAA